MLVAIHMPTSLDITSFDGTRLHATYWPRPPGMPAVVIVPGLGSRRANHSDCAEVCHSRGMGALTLDLRGHGDSEGALGPGALDDVLSAIDALIAHGHTSIGLRGSSMGGFLSLIAASRHPAVRCVVAICPARPEALAARIGDPWPCNFSLRDAVAVDDGVARGYWHATGDATVPWNATAALAQHTAHPRHLRVVLGGSHNSLQHDPRVLADTGAFLQTHLTDMPSAGACPRDEAAIAE